MSIISKMYEDKKLVEEIEKIKDKGFSKVGKQFNLELIVPVYVKEYFDKENISFEKFYHALVVCSMKGISIDTIKKKDVVK